MIENWKDTAFGSDFGGDLLELIESITEEIITFDLLFANTDLKKYLDEPDLLSVRTDNNVNFIHSPFEQYIHFEDMIIGLSALIAEQYLNGKIDLTKAYGNKVLHFKCTEKEIERIYVALKEIHDNPDAYVLFEMCLEEERKETLNDIAGILRVLEKI